MMLRTRALVSIGLVLLGLALGLGLVADPLVRDTLREQRELSARLAEVGGRGATEPGPGPAALWTLWIGIGLAALAAPWVCGVALKALFAPIEELRRACEHVQDEGPARTLDEGRRDELGVLCAAFDRMRARLAQSRRRRERHHEHLETLVSEKTRQLSATLERLRSLDQMKDALLACVSRELKSSVRSILAACKALEKPLALELRGDLERRILSDCSHLHPMAEEILDFVRTSSHGFDCRFEPTTVQEVIRRAIDGVRERMPRRDVEIQLVHLGDCEVVWDGSWIARALESIVRHGLRLAPVGSTLVVENRVQGPDVRIAVRFPTPPARDGRRPQRRNLARALWAPLVERHLGEWSDERTEEQTSILLVLPKLAEHLAWQRPAARAAAAAVR
jgi:signal transduction histidine kinase